MKLSFSKKFVSFITISLAAFSMLSMNSAQAQVVAPQKEQVPGYYRMMLGDFEVTALYDGYVNLGIAVLKGINEPDAQALLARAFLDSSSGVQTSVNAYLVNTGKNLVLVDAGTAKCFGPTMGNVVNNLRASGYTPEQVDAVLLTHLHPDHACGINAQGKPVFSNARVYVSQAEADFWLSSEIAANAPADSQPMFALAQESVAPYIADKKLVTYKIGDSLLDGVQAISSIGHTPGHVSYLFSSKDQNILLWGDIVHSHAIQFMQPEVAMEFDTDSEQAIITRKEIFARAASNRLWIGGAHMPFPGLGHVRAEQKGYSWIPIEYTPIEK